MGGATTTRFLMTTLFTTPFHPIRPSIHIILRRISISPFLTLSNSKIHLTYSNKHQQQLVTSSHSNSNNTNSSFTSQQQLQQKNHPWPEWTNFLNILSNDNSDISQDDDAFVAYEQLPDHFLRASQLCLAFAKERPNLIRLVSRRDVEAVVSNGTPFLFKSAIDTARRMRTFLASDASNESEVEKASTIDLMKYILSYASNPNVASESNGLYSRELVDSSIRTILHELVTVSCRSQTGYVPATSDQSSGRATQTFRPLGRNIEMKRGDWICTKCNFMNFARNMSCLECEEPRPRRQLTGGEWECPKCTFFNYGKNMVCLKCDCKRPGTSPFNTMNSSSGSGYDNNNHPYPGEQSGGTNFSSFLSQPDSSDSDSNRAAFAPFPTNTFSWGDQTPEIKEKKVISVSESGDQSKSNVSPNIGDNTQFPRDSVTQPDKEKDQAEKSKNWFQKIADLHGVKDLPSAISNEDFPEIMPMRKGDNQFVVSKRKDRSLTSPKYKRQAAMDQTENTKFVPFVPFPPGYFTKKDLEQPSVPDSPVKGPSASDAPTKDLKPMGSVDSHSQMSSTSHKFDDNSQTERFSGEEPTNRSLHRAESFKQTENENFKSSWTGPSLEGSAVKETDPLDMSEEAKSERWFKRVAQIKDISELSQIPDEDFPSIMPMRKGVNRFVVSKRKTPLERRLTNQQYRRNLPIVTSDPLKKENES